MERSVPLSVWSWVVVGVAGCTLACDSDAVTAQQGGTELPSATSTAGVASGGTNASTGGASASQARGGSREAGAPPIPPTSGSGAGGSGTEAAGGSESANAGSGGAVAEVVEEEEITFEVENEPPECESGTPGCDCNPVSFSVSTRQSCDMQLDPELTPDGTGFVEIDGTQHLIFTMNRWGDGHVIAWCDSDSAIELMGAFPGWEYLAQSETPRVVMIGSHWGCELNAQYPFWGADIPAQYIDDPAALADDWDVVMLCGFDMGISQGEMRDPNDPDPQLGWPPELEPLLRSFVMDHGKGLFLVMEYFGRIKDQDVTHTNSIVRDAGFSIAPTSVPWGDVTANIELACVPDVPVIR